MQGIAFTLTNKPGFLKSKTSPDFVMSSEAN